jgi:hypothetical protein
MQKIKRCDNISNHKMIVKRKDGQFKYTYKIARAFQNTRGAERSARTGISDEIIRTIRKNKVV